MLLDLTQITIYGMDGRGGLRRWENTINHFYLDVHKRNGTPDPLVTAGIGCALKLPEALTLQWDFQGRPATAMEIQADFDAVSKAPFGLVAEAYATYTRCRLSDSAMDELMRKRLGSFIVALRNLFPAFNAYPETAKAGCLDLVYGTGVAGLCPPHFPAFRSAVSKRDWPAAALECGADVHDRAFDDRNLARRQLFELAAREDPAAARPKA